MYAKLSAGGATYDLVQPTDYIVQLMIGQGLLQKMDKSKLTIMDTFDPGYLNLPFDPGNEYTIPYQAGTDAIVYNADSVPNPPKSWADLWNPDFEGRLVMLDDSRVVIGFTLLTLGYDLNTKDPAQLEEAKAKLKELIPGVKLFDSDSPKTGSLRRSRRPTTARTTSTATGTAVAVFPTSFACASTDASASARPASSSKPRRARR